MNAHEWNHMKLKLIIFWSLINLTPISIIRKLIISFNKSLTFLPRYAQKGFYCKNMKLKIFISYVDVLF